MNRLERCMRRLCKFLRRKKTEPDGGKCTQKTRSGNGGLGLTHEVLNASSRGSTCTGLLHWRRLESLMSPGSHHARDVWLVGRIIYGIRMLVRLVVELLLVVFLWGGINSGRFLTWGRRVVVAILGLVS